MKQIKCHQSWKKRHSLNQVTQKADNVIFRFISIAQDCLPQKTQIRKKLASTKQYEQSNLTKKMPPILRFLSKKYFKHQQQRQQYKPVIERGEKTLTINTFSLKQLKPLESKSPSLPKIRKRFMHIDNNPSQIQPNSPQEVTAVKLKLFNKDEVKIRKQFLQLLDKRTKTKNNIFNNNQLICGWNTSDQNEQNILMA